MFTSCRISTCPRWTSISRVKFDMQIAYAHLRHPLMRISQIDPGANGLANTMYHFVALGHAKLTAQLGHHWLTCYMSLSGATAGAGFGANTQAHAHALTTISEKPYWRTCSIGSPLYIEGMSQSILVALYRDGARSIFTFRWSSAYK